MKTKCARRICEGETGRGRVRSGGRNFHMRNLWIRAVALTSLLLVSPSAVSSAPLSERIGEGIARYHADASARDAALPSIMLAREFPALGPAPRSRKQPNFKFERGGWVIHLTTEPGTSLYGTGEAAGPLRRNGRVVTCWNSDHYAWGADTPSLYQSHPWVLAVRADGSAYGVLADTPGRIVVDLRRGIEFRAQGPAFPVIVIERASPDATRSGWTSTTWTASAASPSTRPASPSRPP